MKCRFFGIVYVLLLFWTVVAGGCSLFNTEQPLDRTVDEKGNLLVADTERMWNDFLEIVDIRVAHEVAGWDPPNGAKSWEEFYLGWFNDIRALQENAEKYVEYIIRARQMHGLPDLKGYETLQKSHNASLEPVGE